MSRQREAAAGSEPVPPGGDSTGGPRRLSPQESARAIREAAGAERWTLDDRQAADLELLLDGALRPLTGFLGREDYRRVLETMRLASGALWPIPVVLGVDPQTAERLAPGAPLLLVDRQGTPRGRIEVRDRFAIDAARECLRVYGTEDATHPGVARLLADGPRVGVEGPLTGFAPGRAADFGDLRLSPEEVRREIAARGWPRTVAFQTRNPLHRAHFEITRRAMDRIEGGLLLHPVTGPTRPGDLDAPTRVRAYRAVLPRYPENRALLALLPLAMRMAGPREAVWHALVRRNFGCTHMIVGRDHAGPGADAAGRPFYDPLEAQRLAQRHAEEMGIAILPFGDVAFSARRRIFLEPHEVEVGEPVESLSGTELRRRLARREPLPEWFTFPEVERELGLAARRRERAGFVVFFTGLSGAGKSTLAEALRRELEGRDERAVLVLDGDEVRRFLSSELGFSADDRDLNVRRIGFVAAQFARAGGIAICAPIAPYERSRQAARALAEEGGAGFVLVHVATPLATCEGRDRKGLYAKARAGLIPAFTGVSDPYEEPRDAELVLDTTGEDEAESLARLLAGLERLGYSGGPAPANVSSRPPGGPGPD